jgi:[protein-PII] uridylyltransferase
LPGQEQLIQSFVEARKALIDQDLGQDSNLSIVRKYTGLMDQFIQSLFYNAGFTEDIRPTQDNSLTVAALGSYGRRELCLGSDVDLMVIHQGKLSQQMRDIIVRTIYPLLDAKLEVGHSILTVQECIRLCLNDFSVLTSVMDSRFLLGSKTFFLLFEEAFWSKIYREIDSFLKKFLLYKAKRSEKFHTEAYLVEPDIKEGSGGLRDLHFMAWMAKLYFKCKSLGQIKKLVALSIGDLK